jgi:hypothetical protein
MALNHRIFSHLVSARYQVNCLSDIYLCLLGVGIFGGAGQISSRKRGCGKKL